MSELSVWDLDGTIRPGALAGDAICHGIEEGFIDPSLFVDARNPTYEEVPHFYEAITKRSRHDFQALMDRLSDEAQEMAYPWALDRLREHTVTYEPVLLSHSPDFLVRAFARGLGVFRRSSGSYFHTKDLVFSGRGVTLDKPRMLTRYQRQLQLPTIAYAAGDSESDVPLLLRAKAATVVNPGSRLAELAIINGWEIVNT